MGINVADDCWGRLIGYWQPFLFWLPLGLAAFFMFVLVVSILLVKYGMHPTERVPVNKNSLDPFDLMRSRYSCRSFQSRDLTAQHHVELMKLLQINSQQNQQIGQQPVRFEYVTAPLIVWPVVGAHEFLVAIAPRKYNRISIIDVGRSLQKIVLSATRMGIATCWIGPGADQESIEQHLGDTYDSKKDHVICVCAIGYQSMYKPLFLRIFRKIQKHRRPLTELFFTDPSFKISLDIDSKPYSDYGRCYEVCQWSPSSFNGQTTRCAAVTHESGNDKKLLRFDFCAATASRFYAPVALGIWCANWEMGVTALNKRGHFSALSFEERAFEVLSELPRYDVSWIID